MIAKINAEDAARPFRIEGAKPARFVEPFKGVFTRWKVGDRVFAKLGRGGKYIVDRVRWRGAMVPLCNQCYGIPKSALMFE